MSDVFISYSRKNSAFAHRLIDGLTLANKDAWVDWEGIPLTSPNWWSEIKAGIEGADSFVFILSPDSMASVVCNLELDYAIELQKRIIPLVYEDVVTRDAFASIADFQPDAAMEERLAGKDSLQIARDNWQRLSHINWVFFRDSDDFDTAFKTLVITVETDLPYVKAHTRYLTRALEWQREGQRADLLLFGAEIDAAERWLVKAESYATKQASGKVEVVNPLPEAVQRDYVAASRRAQQRRRLLAGSGVLVAAFALVFAVVALLAGVQANNNANAANTQVAQALGTATQIPPTLTLAHEQVVDAQAQADAAQEREATATRQVATAVAQVEAAQATATQIPPTLTQAAVLRQEAVDEQTIANEFSETIAQSVTNTGWQIERMDHLVEQFPNSASAYYVRAVTFSRTGDCERSILDSSRAIVLNPTYANAYLQRGVCYSALGNNDQAIADFTHVIALNPEDSIAYNNRGSIYKDLGDYERAIADYNNAIFLDPINAIPYVGRGEVYNVIGEYERAITDFDQAIAFDPIYARAYDSRGLAYFALGDYERANTDIDHAILLSPTYAPFYLSNRGQAYQYIGNYERAIADYSQAITINPDYAFAYWGLGNTYYDMNRMDEALTNYRHYLELAGNGASSFVRGRVAELEAVLPTPTAAP
ncbi:MAG: toll/interleukin-1 receptor domain-containing protein [Anaerolineaceae bacterium]|nr:toll/interleukin-1 receptor domain-containing protein [Anaerolineaceae bacterium]